MATLLFILYAIPLLIIVLFSLQQLYLVVLYWRRKWKKKQRAVPPPLDSLPLVALQLPIYNELYVVEGLLEAVGKLDYPKDLLDIQILDDSTDETTDIIALCAEQLRAQGWRVQHIRRDNRQGFKAGALAYGNTLTTAEYIAIFDADFVPKPDFLRQTLPHFFGDERIGAVQTRWGHLNETFSIFTRLQAMMLDSHFILEQWGRHSFGYFINFNGTAGIWRRSCIEQAGGWQSDTLTEDLDLSYRAQPLGWRFVFLPDVVTPAELPVAMQAIKSQQFRWVKGGAECARKNLGAIWSNAAIPFSRKIQASLHLLNSSIFLCVLLLSLLSLPMMFIGASQPQLAFWLNIASYLGWSMVAVVLFFWTSHQHLHGGNGASLLRFVRTFPLLLMVSMGFSFHNGLAVLEGYIGKKSPFIRTPKFGLTQQKNSNWTNNKYLSRQFAAINYWELGFALLFLSAAAWGIAQGHWGSVPFHLLMGGGYLLVMCGGKQAEKAMQ